MPQIRACRGVQYGSLLLSYNMVCTISDVQSPCEKAPYSLSSIHSSTRYSLVGIFVPKRIVLPTILPFYCRYIVIINIKLKVNMIIFSVGLCPKAPYKSMNK